MSTATEPTDTAEMALRFGDCATIARNFSQDLGALFAAIKALPAGDTSIAILSSIGERLADEAECLAGEYLEKANKMHRETSA